MKRGSEEGRRRQAEGARKAHTTHGMRNSREYSSWQAMKGRCLDPSDSFFATYGGRGVKVHPSWIASFEAFYADMGPRPTGTSLDRYPDGAGNYEPGNCRWATDEEQQRNRSSNRKITFRGETMIMVEWAERIGINPKTLKTRLNKLHWSVERALTEPLRGSEGRHG